MTRGSVGARLALAAALALAVDALPRSGLAASAPARGPGARRVSVVPLFDARKAFKPKRTFKLRFRARDAASGAPLPADDISFSLRHAASELPLVARQVKSGVFEVPFSPAGPGLYLLAVAIRGVRDGAVRPVRLGVVGVSDGLIELPPEADADVNPRGKHVGRFTH